MRAIYYLPYNVVVYATAAVALVIGACTGSLLPLFIQCFMFFLWDMSFVLGAWPLDEEPVNVAVTRSITIRTLTSYFFPLYGILFGLLFVIEHAKQTAFLNLCSRAGVPMPLLLMPFALSSVNLLFIPVAVSRKGKDHVSPAFRGMLFVVTLCQQCSVIVFAHCVLRIAYTLS